MSNTAENPFNLRGINVLCDHSVDSEKVRLIDLDEEISFKFNASDDSISPDLSSKILEFNRLIDQGFELVIISSFHPNIVIPWKKETFP